ncbi:NADP-dependent oxidoreductase [Microbacterium rhizophilus]|uniref:NADP-dependent oxidoreductase n=1 Tax=Microbacterium rhizophilus TaxID=3138934 RepID=UPI0031ED1FDD
MRAVAVPTAGERPAVIDLAAPGLRAGDVLVQVRAAGLNPMDNALASGALSGAMEHRYPLVLGRDLAGVVEAVGAEVTRFAPGDEVIGHIGFEAPFQIGALTDLVALPEAALARKPGGLDDVRAAALPLAGGAAIAVVEATGAAPGDVVLVNGASGAVGRFAVQLLAGQGAVVVATASEGNADRLRELGAAEIVSYASGDISGRVRALHPEGVDALVNLWGSTVEDVPLDAVKPGGVVATITPVPGAETAAARGLRGGGIIIASPTADVLAGLAEKVAVGSLEVDVSRVVALADATAGLDDIAAGRAGGKIVVDLA